MAAPTNDVVFLLVCLVHLSTATARVQSSNPFTAALSALQSSSSNGVISMNDTILRRIHSLPTPRPFHFLVFFDSKKLHSRSELALPSLKSEFSLVSSSFLTNNNKSRSQLLFFHVELDESHATFALFDVIAIPHIRIIPASATDLNSDSIKLNPAYLSTLLDSLPEVILSETAISVGPIHHPPLISKTQMTLAMATAVILSPYAVKKLASGESVVHEKSTWMAGAVFVYFCSVSGTMFNIIRKAPMFTVDMRKDGGETMKFFYRGAGAQLGAEGFIVGFLYTVVGLLLAFVCHVVVRVRDAKWQRVSMIMALLVSFFAVRQVISFNSWKTGYNIHAYW
ncbi:hypothetical protein SASPL_121266 [Salvia splendens]|uniref:Oligosaccharyltransferase complex subunit gamma n=1 Tax=Salvia splendens TaxID=180675 RepID=A0A8X8ZUL9_SALSN|nr:hypothetical protein SASPL_121266 [Salvia splendens]